LFDGLARDVDDGPRRILPKNRLRVRDLLRDVIALPVRRIRRHPEVLQPRLPNLQQRLGLDGEPEHPLLIDREQLRRRIDPQHQRHVRHLQPLLRQERRQRRLRRARDPDEHQVRLRQIARLAPVVVAHGELHRLDAPEVLVADGVQQARHALRLRPEIRRQLRHERADQIDRVDVLLVAQPAQELAMRRRHHREHDERVHLLGAVHDRSHLRLEPHARVHAQLHRNRRELQERRAHDLLGRLAGGVGDYENQPWFAHRTGSDGSMRPMRVIVPVGLFVTFFGVLVACNGDNQGPRSTFTTDEAAAARSACQFGTGTMPGLSLAKDATIGTDMPIDTIVVLMLENRSFDHMLQNLPAFGQPDAEVAPAGATNPDADGTPRPTFHLDTYCFDDTSHGWNDVHTEWNHGAMDGFVVANNHNDNAPADGKRAMGYYTEADLPYFYSLANTFALADHNFSSVVGPTFPNREYLYAATSFGHIG